MKIKFLSLLLAISLIAGLFPVAMVSAETTATDAPTSATASKATTGATSAPTTAPTTKPATVAPTTKPTAAPTTKPAVAPTTKPAAATTAATTLGSTPTQPATTAPTVTTPTTAPTTGTINPNANAASISIRLCETSVEQKFLAVLTAVKGGAPVYATTKESGIPTLVTDNFIPSNNYVKFEYPATGLPTITLMNAKLRSSGTVLDLSSFDISVKIVIAGNSTIESTTKYGIYRASHGDITILGPQKLSMNCHASAIAFHGDSYANTLTLKELPLKVTSFTNAGGCAIQIPAGNLVVDRSTVDIVNRTGIAVYLGKGNIAGHGSATIYHSVFSTNSQSTGFKLDGNLAIYGSNAQFSSDTQAVSCAGNLSLDNSTLVMTGRSNTIETADVHGSFTLRTSNAEIIGTKFVIFSDTTLPITIGKYTVVAGITKDSSATYIEDLVGAYQYYYAESLEQPTDPTTPTATDPTETDSTLAPPIEPTGDPMASPEITLPPAPAPTLPVNNASSSGTLFWILAALMVLCACGAVAMAIIMFRRSALEEYEDELEDTSEETPTEEDKKFSLKDLKKFFVRKRKEDIFEDSPAEAEENPTEEISEEIFEEPQTDIDEEISEEVLEEPQKDIDDELEDIIKEFHEDPQNNIEEPQEDIVEVSMEKPDEEPTEDIDETPKKFSLNSFKKFFAKILDEVTDETTEDSPASEADTETEHEN